VDIPSLRYFRTLAYQKPALRLDYLGLLGTETRLSTHEGIEEYFKRCTLFGVYPSIGRRCDEAYQKFGDVYKTYMPILRQLGAAGWQPVTYASSEDEKILIERFGPKEPGTSIFFTIYNARDQEKSTRIRMDAKTLHIGAVESASELVRGQALPAGMEFPLTIGPGDLRVIELRVRM
jgi:hypothetical protein